MGLRVISCCSYLTGAANVTWCRRDHDAHDFVRAIKGQPIRGFAQIPCRGEAHLVDNGNRDFAVELFSKMTADAARAHVLAAATALVPVPNSRCDVRSLTPPRTLMQAEELALELGHGVVVADVLRWSQILPSCSRGGGLRKPLYLLDRLRVVGAIGAEHLPCILVDDVMTTGAHVQACAAALRMHGHPVELALVAGRACHERVAKPFTVRVEELADVLT